MNTPILQTLTTADSAVITATLAQRHYLASDDDVRVLARVSVAGTAMLETSRACYMRVLLAHSQVALGLSEPREHSARALAPIDKDARAAQRSKFDEVNARLYALVLAENPSGRGKGAALERHSRTAFARSAASTLRGAIAVGVDLTALGVADTSKGSLAKLTAARTTKRARPQQSVKRKLSALRRRITGALDALDKSDKLAARELAQSLIDQLGGWLVARSTPTTNATAAIRNNLPLTVRGTTLLPIRAPINGDGAAKH